MNTLNILAKVTVVTILCLAVCKADGDSAFQDLQQAIESQEEIKIRQSATDEEYVADHNSDGMSEAFENENPEDDEDNDYDILTKGDDAMIEGSYRRRYCQRYSRGRRVKPFICCLVDFLKSCYSTRETPTVSEVCFKDRQPKLAMLQCSGTNYVGKPSKGSCYLTSKLKCREGYFDDAKVSIQYYRYMNRWRSSMRSFFNSSKYKWTRCCKITTE